MLSTQLDHKTVGATHQSLAALHALPQSKVRLAATFAARAWIVVYHDTCKTYEEISEDPGVK